MTADFSAFFFDHMVDRPCKEMVSCTQVLGEKGHEAVKTLAQIGYERIRFFGPLIGGKLGNVFFWDPYSGHVGTLEVQIRQESLFEDTLERLGADRIEAGLDVLMQLPSIEGAVRSLEELEVSGAQASWGVAVILARLAQAHPGLSFRCEGRKFKLPELFSRVQTEFVSDEVVSLADCVVTDASSNDFVQIMAWDAKASGLSTTFKAFVTRDNAARSQLDLACLLDSKLDVVRVRRVRTLSQAEQCARVESVQVDASRIHRAVDRRLGAAE